MLVNVPFLYVLANLALTSEQKWFVFLNTAIAVVAIATIVWLVIKGFQMHQTKTIEELKKLRAQEQIQEIALLTEEQLLAHTNRQQGGKEHPAPLRSENQVLDREFTSELSEYYRLLEAFNLTESDSYDLEAFDASIPESEVEEYAFPETDDPVLLLIYRSIQWNKFLLFEYDGNRHIARPVSTTIHSLKAYSYLKNSELSFEVSKIENLRIRENYCLLRVKKPETETMNSILDTAIVDQKPIRIHYERPPRKIHSIDPETWELLVETTPEETTIRTITAVQRSINVLSPEDIAAYSLDEDYITGFCHLRGAMRTFKVARILKLEILDA